MPDLSTAPNHRWAQKLRALIEWLFASARSPKQASGTSQPLDEKAVIDDEAIAPHGSRLRSASPRTREQSTVVDSIRRGLTEVPPLPHVVRELLAELSDPASTARTVARIASSDPALAAALIRTVNSAAMGLRRKVTSVSDAVSYLGYTTVRSLVVRMRLERVMPRPKGQRGYDVEDLWIHSMAVAHAAEALAERSTVSDKGFVATLGLLHDIGKLAINCHFPAAADALVDRSKHFPEESFLDRERRILGADHAEIGAMLGTHWKLPADLVEAIRWHHAPADAPATLPAHVRQASIIVHLANQLAKYCYVYSEDMEIDIIPDELFAEVGLAGPMNRLLSNRVRSAISRAVFFADEAASQPIDAIRRFMRFCSSDEAQHAMSMRRTHTPGELRVRIIESGADSLFPSDTPSVEATFIQPGGREPKWLGKPCARFAGPASGMAAEALVSSVIAHQDSLDLDDTVRLPARFLVRRLMPNLVDLASGARVEICQQLIGRRLRLSLRCDELKFERRFGDGINPRIARRVVEQELANVLNLRWFSEIYTCKEGAILSFTTHPSRT